jgi:type IV secretion system protein VirB8
MQDLTQSSESGNPRELLGQYFREAKSWEVDREAQARRSAKVAWVVASLMCVIAGSAVFAVTMMLPLHRVEPYVVRVDQSTGIVDVVNTLRKTSSTQDEAVSKYFIGRYIRAREGYAYALVDANWREIALLSGAQQREQFKAYLFPSNPKSPVNTLKKRGTIEIKIKSIQFIQPSVAAVRYWKYGKVDGAITERSDWIATVTFGYRKAAVTEQVREINPLGFTVTDYRTDKEVVDDTDVTEADTTTPVTEAGHGS